tara:strand:+ start:9352 stop:10506 length:1155 start_codon:yes stop_codon:yes gene_type:complete
VINEKNLLKVRGNYLNFINSMKIKDDEYSFTFGSESSPYALCFAIFGYNLLCEKELIINNDNLLTSKLIKNLKQKRKERINNKIKISTDKQYLQLLCFTLSCIKILKKENDVILKDEIEELIPENVGTSMKTQSVFECKGGTGNYAMFIAIILIYARDYLKIECHDKIDEWVNLHLKNMNPNSLWGQFNEISHHQFQNGYHQYEILEYLKYDYPNEMLNNLEKINLLADINGQFAPWPGGAACHDYDACFLLSIKSSFNENDLKLFKIIISSILQNQNDDGGFCESHSIRPRTFHNIKLFLQHLYSVNKLTFKERLRQFITLQRPKHDKIHSYVSNSPREWSESNLWDSWFRMMTIARLDCKVSPENFTNWGFIDFPGIGYFRK